jgi:hypothetical protein
MAIDELALIAFANKSSRHGFLYFSSHIDTPLESRLITGFGNVCFEVAKAATCDHAIGISAPKFSVDISWRVFFRILAKWALSQIR